MRVTQNMITRNFLKNLNRNLSNLAASNQRMSSGRRFSNVSDNVSDTSRALKIRKHIKENEQYLVNVREARSELDSAESNLESISEILKTVQEKALRGMSSTTSTEGRTIIAREIDNLNKQLLQFANAQYAERYLFGGTNNQTSPFTVDSNGALLYNTIPVDDIQKDDNGYFYMDGADRKEIPQNEEVYIDVGLGLKIMGDSNVDKTTAVQVSFSGIDIFGYGKNADGLPNNLYNILRDISSALSPTFDSDKLDASFNQLKEQRDRLMIAITDIGTRESFLAKTVDRVEDDLANLNVLHDKLEYIDDPEEATNMQMYQYTWLATLQLGSKLIPQSLMDFIR